MPAVRILLVEDESIVAMDIQHRLENMGYEVAGWLAAGDRIVAEIERLRPDLVLMDIRLQEGMDGIQAAQVIRRQFNIPLVYLTAYADEETLRRAKETDPFGFVLKPYHDRELHTAIELALYKFRAGQQLRENEEWLSVTLRSVSDGVVATDAAERVKLINPVAEKITGFPPAAALGRPVNDVVRLADAAGRPVPFGTGGFAPPGISGPAPGDLSLLAASGRRIPVEVAITPMRDPHGRPLGAVIMIRDRSEARRAQAALEEERNLLRTLIDAFPDSIYIKDTASHFITGNRALAMRMGLENPDELIGKTDFDFYPREYAEKFRADELRVIESGKALVNYEEPSLDTAGNVRWLLTSKAPLHNREGHVIGLVGTGRDITERKRRQAERERIDAGLREMQKQESIGVIAAGVAHDFNNMLMSIQGGVDLALLNLRSPASVGNHLKDIKVACQRAADLTQQLLAYAGKAQYRMEPLRLSVLILEMSRLIRPMLGKRADFQLQLNEQVPPVIADATQIRQMLMNLVLNASEALGQAPGIIRVELGLRQVDARTPHSALRRKPLPPGTYACIKVADTGCGMDAATLARMFEPFFTTKFIGRGLGLSVILGIVRHHQGDILVESEPGKGTTFQILLPCQGTAPPAA